MSLVPEVKEHMRIFGEDGRTGLLFVGPKGGRLRRNNFHDTWRAAPRRRRDQEIADHVDRLIKKSKKVKRPKGDGDSPNSGKIN
ncbi:hypothetical protein ACH4NT_23710 [Streptomyces lydicus]|uniref:hypothetical protein n=1 Tax=Streptomyces lydicus TaxID=47763 RepID=UPI003793AA25